MSELEAKISTMQEGAQQLRSSSQRLSLALRHVQQTVDELIVLGFQSPAADQFITQYHSQRTLMDDLPIALLSFANRLDDAVDDLQLALHGRLPSAIVTPSMAIPASNPTVFIAAPFVPAILTPIMHYRLGGTSSRVNSEVIAVPVEHGLRDYVSRANQGLMQEWNMRNNAIEQVRDEQTRLREQRDAKVRELNALTNRIIAQNPGADLDKVAKIQSLRADIANIDTNISTLDGQITRMEQELNTFTTRLERIKPAAGADLALIASMETTKTPDIVIQNTYDCVNYLAKRVSIPPNMATDAYLWDDNVARLPEYGMRVGDTPLQGSILVMEREHSFGSDLYGHVAYVERVDLDGTIWITDNFNPDTPVRLTDITDEISGANIHYVYLPWNTVG
jgi:surface antigen